MNRHNVVWRERDLFDAIGKNPVAKLPDGRLFSLPAVFGFDALDLALDNGEHFTEAQQRATEPGQPPRRLVFSLDEAIQWHAAKFARTGDPWHIRELDSLQMAKEIDAARTAKAATA